MMMMMMMMMNVTQMNRTSLARASQFSGHDKTRQDCDETNQCPSPSVTIDSHSTNTTTPTSSPSVPSLNLKPPSLFLCTHTRNHEVLDHGKKKKKKIITRPQSAHHTNGRKIGIGTLAFFFFFSFPLSCYFCEDTFGMAWHSMAWLAWHGVHCIPKPVSQS